MRGGGARALTRGIPGQHDEALAQYEGLLAVDPLISAAHLGIAQARRPQLLQLSGAQWWPYASRAVRPDSLLSSCAAAADAR